MDKKKLAKLEASGWKAGSAQDFLQLSDEEAAFVESKVALAQALKAFRAEQDLSQVEAAQLLRSSQSRVAKMEAADQTVTVDLILRSLFKLGATQKDVADALRPRRAAKAH